MGLTPGTEVVITRRALGADPIEVQLRGTRICLRRADAARFPVRLVSPAQDQR
jgi:Fe2+ transport system protein FeoA